jgi:hypothetical protein
MTTDRPHEPTIGEVRPTTRQTALRRNPRFFSRVQDFDPETDPAQYTDAQ